MGTIRASLRKTSDLNLTPLRHQKNDPRLQQTRNPLEHAVVEDIQDRGHHQGSQLHNKNNLIPFDNEIQARVAQQTHLVLALQIQAEVRESDVRHLDHLCRRSGDCRTVNIHRLCLASQPLHQDKGTEILHHHRCNDEIIQIWLLTPLSYIAVCVYFGLFSMRLAGFYGLYSNHQTDAPSLIFLALNLSRVATPLCYNYLQMVNIEE